jgi:hypothetical protein
MRSRLISTHRESAEYSLREEKVTALLWTSSRSRPDKLKEVCALPSHCEITAACRFEPFAHASWNDHYLRALWPSTAPAPDASIRPTARSREAIRNAQ